MLYGGKDGRGLQAQYVVLDSDGDRLVPTLSLAPTHIGGPMAGLKPLGHSFYFPGGKPASASFCWFNADQACSEGAFTDLRTLWELSVDRSECFNIMAATQFVVVLVFYQLLPVPTV